MNKKMLNSKWTAVNPTDKEKHFIVIKIEYTDEKENSIKLVTLEAIITGQHYKKTPQDLNNKELWIKGWKS